jgi:phosphatidylglycerophosphatase A
MESMQNYFKPFNNFNYFNYFKPFNIERFERFEWGAGGINNKAFKNGSYIL